MRIREIPSGRLFATWAEAESAAHESQSSVIVETITEQGERRVICCYPHKGWAAESLPPETSSRAAIHWFCTGVFPTDPSFIARLKARDKYTERLSAVPATVLLAELLPRPCSRGPLAAWAAPQGFPVPPGTGGNQSPARAGGERVLLRALLRRLPLGADRITEAVSLAIQHGAEQHGAMLVLEMLDSSLGLLPPGHSASQIVQLGARLAVLAQAAREAEREETPR